ncbi:hypothetical protein PCANC_01156 [Puccinia coronata f. sp. avenae]|jgi:hypothetical protein|uniref:Uncharacterized protein n=1 Tax=Puccinia coronata f. sp. avenae TaxID=200324 RepID=A0A2N5W5R5_9BASI|nr:hypothetical protein PCANC_18464 [Puccinia coronata f. sp. avenae]PLW57584.1 hypothetical protein PCANC_01156 [Puccinia coronata f. sp. avenae]
MAGQDSLASTFTSSTTGLFTDPAQLPDGTSDRPVVPHDAIELHGPKSLVPPGLTVTNPQLTQPVVLNGQTGLRPASPTISTLPEISLTSEFFSLTDPHGHKSVLPNMLTDLHGAISVVLTVVNLHQDAEPTVPKGLTGLQGANPVVPNELTNFHGAQLCLRFL